MNYERYSEAYPDPNARNPNGTPMGFGQFGYADHCLHAAMSRDDADAFKFYFERYFSLDGLTLGGSVVLITANRGAPKCVKALIKMGAKDPAYDADKLIAIANKNKRA